MEKGLIFGNERQSLSIIIFPTTRSAQLPHLIRNWYVQSQQIKIKMPTVPFNIRVVRACAQTPSSFIAVCKFQEAANKIKMS